MTTAPRADEPKTDIAAPQPSPLAIDLGTVVALGFLPLTLLGFCVPELRVELVLFVVGVGIHCILLRRRGRPVITAAVTGAWLLPVIVLVSLRQGLPEASMSDFLCSGVALSMLGLVAGWIAAKQFEPILVSGSFLRRRIHPKVPSHEPFTSLRNQLDEASTPLDVPPLPGLPRRFGVRGLLIVTTWAALLMGFLRACGAGPTAHFIVMTFFAGALAGQMLLFRGRRPLTASMWVGAFLLPLETLAVNLYANWQVITAHDTIILEFAVTSAILVPVGILCGAVAGAVSGLFYRASDDLFVWSSRSLPKLALEPVTDADVDVLIGWIFGPKSCRRWAGDQIGYPLDRQQLLDRFAASRAEHPVRRIFKAVDLRTGNMLGYAELGRIDYFARRAVIELLLVDPNVSERGRVGVLLLRAVTDLAFYRLRLFALMVFAANEQSEVAICCERAWRARYDLHSYRNEADGIWVARVRRLYPTP